MVERGGTLIGTLAADFDRFMRSAFAPLAEGEKAALATAKPRRDGDGVWFDPRRWRPGEPQPGQGLHFNCCAFDVAASRALGELTTRSFVVMLDDVGDLPGKSQVALDRVLALPQAARPHAIVSTRRHGNYINGQACWFIEPAAPEAARALVRAACKAGWGDPAATGGLRWARPPGSIKRDNDHAALLLSDNLAAPRVGIGALAAALGVPDFMAENDHRAARARRAMSADAVRPPASLVRSAMAALRNDVERADWICIGMALKWSTGPSPAISDSEAGSLFRIFSEGHESFNARNTSRAWATFHPSGAITFATIAWVARRCGWREFDFWQRLFAERERLEAQMDMEDLFVAMAATAASEAEPSPKT